MRLSRSFLAAVLPKAAKSRQRLLVWCRIGRRFVCEGQRVYAHSNTHSLRCEDYETESIEEDSRRMGGENKGITARLYFVHSPERRTRDKTPETTQSPERCQCARGVYASREAEMV